MVTFRQDHTHNSCKRVFEIIDPYQNKAFYLSVFWISVRLRLKEDVKMLEEVK